MSYCPVGKSLVVPYGPSKFSPGFAGPTSASLYPTNVRWGDVMTVMVPNAQGTFQGSVVVRFQGAPAMSVMMTSRGGGSVVVPDGAQTGSCTVEVDGRQVYGTNCVVTPSVGGPKPKERTGSASWAHGPRDSWMSDPALPDYLKPKGGTYLGAVEEEKKWLDWLTLGLIVGAGWLMSRR